MKRIGQQARMQEMKRIGRVDAGGVIGGEARAADGALGWVGCILQEDWLSSSSWLRQDARGGGAWWVWGSNA